MAHRLMLRLPVHASLDADRWLIVGLYNPATSERLLVLQGGRRERHTPVRLSIARKQHHSLRILPRSFLTDPGFCVMMCYVMYSVMCIELGSGRNQWHAIP
jgi:hypothetical protein